MTWLAGPSVVSARAAQVWAVAKGAPADRVEVVVTEYWTYAPQVGLRAEVAFCQAMHETGWLRWPGNSAPWNMAGIKTPWAAGDRPEDHEQFASPEVGVKAHLAHLCAYAHLIPPAGWAAPRTLANMRLYASWAPVTTVEELGGKWAPSPTYGVRVAMLVAQLADSVPEEEDVGVGVEIPGWGLTFLSTADIGLRKTAGRIDPKKLDHFIVHYSTGATLGPQSKTLDGLMQWVRNIDHYHRDTLGYSGGVAYNWLVGRHPSDPQRAYIFEGRGDERVGGHTLGWNSRAVAVCFLGGDDPFLWDTTPGVGRAIRFCRDVREWAHLGRRHANWPGWGHRDAPGNSTSCPGDELERWVRAGMPTAPFPG